MPIPVTAPQHALLQAQAVSWYLPTGEALFERQDWVVRPGLTWVRGGESRGKTTLLRLMAGVLTPSAGAVCGPAGWALDDPVGHRRLVFWQDKQDRAQDGVPINDAWRAWRQHWPDWSDERWEAAVERLELTLHLGKTLGQLSTGSRHKVLLAAAWAAQAPVVLLDEPFTALDLPSRRVVLAWLEQASAATHQAWVVADYELPEGLTPQAVIDLGD